jgi:methionyl aminopeptidase
MPLRETYSDVKRLLSDHHLHTVCQEANCIMASNHIVAEILNKLREKVRPGVTTGELDICSEELVRKRGAVPAFKGYMGYPNSLCISVNSEVVHGIPSDRVLEAGDIVSLDFGAYYKGYYGDAAITVPVGDVSAEAARLIRITEQGLYDGIKEARAGNRLGDISSAVQNRAETAGFSVVRDFVGHGIGRDLHEEPQVPNFGAPHQGPRLEGGMVIALEPLMKRNWLVSI